MSKNTWAYIVGVALGDGNLSNPNGRAIRLRVTCDARYPVLAEEIITALKKVLPRNAVSVVRAKTPTYFNISVYSNTLEKWMPWHVGKGSKFFQNARVPLWIRKSKTYTRSCLRGLLQTDGSIYEDRGYLMVNFSNNTKILAEDVYAMLNIIGFSPTFTETSAGCNTKYTVRLARNARSLIESISLQKNNHENE